jgi:hypothetical protein
MYHYTIELEGVLSQFMAWVVEDVASRMAPPVPPPSHFHRRNLKVFDILKGEYDADTCGLTHSPRAASISSLGPWSPPLPRGLVRNP